jgi:transcription antitermination factor NusG
MSKASVLQRFWFALYTKPRSEFKAAKQLEEAGVEYYLPSITRLKQWSDRKKKITEPLIHGYIFIFADEKERILSLTQASIVRCISDKGIPAKIPSWQIDNLRTMLQTDTEYIIREGLIPGVKIKILDGPFKDVIAVYREDANEKTIAVSIELLNRSVLAHLPKESSFEIMKDQNE